MNKNPPTRPCAHRLGFVSELKRNKHIQHVLVEAAKLAPRCDPSLALLYAKEKQKGNTNRATLAVARRILIYLLTVDHEQRDLVPRREFHSVAA
jgi:hypothetical protein